MKILSVPLVLVMLAVTCWFFIPRALQDGLGQETPQTKKQPGLAQQAGQVPSGQPAAETAPSVPDAVPFTTNEGKHKGWKIAIPGQRPLATPAVVDGKVFVGGGFGSHEFYAFDAATGKKLWQYQTTDDGPTAAVAQDGYVAFNTESCELEIITANGKPVWKKWLGDPLMSMPAISQGKVYMAYPNSKGDHEHYLGCFDLKTGKEFWKKQIAGEIITAPVVADEHLHLATLEGTLYCFGKHDGELLWKAKKNATSAPVVWKNRCYFSRREEVTETKKGKKVKQQTEQMAARGLGVKDDTSNLVATARSADYLDFNKRMNSPLETENQKKDAGVGFGAGLGGFGGGLAGLGGGLGGKGDAKIEQALGNLGQASVAGIWSYQGSKPFIYKERLYLVMGDTLQCVDPTTEKIVWKRTFHQKKDKGNDQPALLDSVVTPPALVNDKAFVGTSYGQVTCLSTRSGEVLWSGTIGESIAFQPAVAKGRVYVSTSLGKLYSLETGDAKDDGWLMWGADAGHNGLPK